MTINGGKPHEVGDRGQRYEVTFFNPATGKRQPLGWSDTQEGVNALVGAIDSHPSWEQPQVQDRRKRMHDLKTDPDVFQAVTEGLKTYEIRKNDRGFAVGDLLVLRETVHYGAEMAAGAPLAYTGRQYVARVTHMLTGPVYGLAAGWSILSMRSTSEEIAP